MKFKRYENMINMPKMTNNHIHIFAMYPYYKFLKKIKKIDPELYNNIYILNKECNSSNYCLPINTLYVINEQNEGNPYDDPTTPADWNKLTNTVVSKKQYIIPKTSVNSWEMLEKIQSMVGMFVRNYKIYYYYWYLSLYINYKHNVFYLNVRKKPGSICKDVKMGSKLFMSSVNKLSYDEFVSELKKIDRPLKPYEYKYAYKQYASIKYESDLILLAVDNFNKTKKKLKFIENDKLINYNINTNYQTKYTGEPQMMIQYIITFPKPNKNTEQDAKFFNLINVICHIAIIINKKYNFPFFNGIDFVGNEDQSDNNILILAIDRLKYLKKYNITIIPHIGETKSVNKEIEQIIKHSLNNNITRFAHGLLIPQSNSIMQKIKSMNKKIYSEICPISNARLKYFSVKNNPYRKFINNALINIMICSDDNALFGYYTVTNDYIALKHYWKLDNETFKKIILNGISCINPKYVKYYTELFEALWDKFIKIDN